MTSRGSWAWLFAVALVSLASFVGPVFGQQDAGGTRTIEQVRWIQLPDNAAIVCVDPVSGVGAVLVGDNVGSQRGSLHIYPSLTSAPLAQPKVVDLKGADATSAAPAMLKGKRVLLVGDSLGSLNVVDQASGAVLSRIAIGSPIESAIATPDGTKAIYAVGNSSDRSGQPSNDSCFGVVDLVAGVDKGRLKLDRSGRSYEISAQSGDRAELEGISPDAEYVYISRRFSSPSGVRSCRIDWASNTVSMAYSEHESTWSYVVTPVGVACERSLRSMSLEREVLKLATHPMCRIGETALVLGVSQEDSSTYTVASLNNGATVTRFRLPEDHDGNRRRYYSGQFGAWYDGAASAVLIQGSDGLASVDVAALGAPSEPLLGVGLRGARSLTVDTPWQATLEPLVSGSKIKVLSPPDRVSLKQQVLTWTPKIEDVGPQRIELEIQQGGVTAKQQIELRVELAGAKLPFRADFASVGADGTLLAIASGPMERWSGVRETTPARLALLDASKWTVTLERTLDFSPSSALVVGQRVIVADQNADALHVFEADGTERTVYTTGRAQSMRLVGNRLYVRAAQRTVLDATTLARIEEAPVDGAASRVNVGRSQSLPVRVEDAWRIDGTVRSSDLSSVILLEAPDYFGDNTQLDAGVDVSRGYRGQWGENMDERWGARIEGSSVNRASGQKLAQAGSARGIILSRAPFAAFLVASDRPGSSSDSGVVLEMIDLSTAKSRKLTIMRDVANDEGGGGSNRDGFVFETPTGLLAVVGNQVAVIKDSLLDIKAGAQPIRFEPRQSLLVGDASKPIKLTYKVDGGVAPITYTLGRALQGVTIDRNTGAITIEPSQLPMDAIVKQIAMTAAYDWNQANANDALPERADWTKFATRVLEMIDAPGVKVTGVPVPMRIGVKARDANQQEAHLTHMVILDFAADRFDNAYAEQREQLMRQRDASRVPPVAHQEDSELEAENKRLREEIERLKGQIELLKQMLEEKGK